ncbi:hypothetical protein C0Q70_01733 [Pomacea canaliculata]|uniref:Uncharacterized protein n=1 Tax=Pomacea canaliculata TaxID=400727 RepID=A0A2T7Q0A1_POMCA|nr:hypothetical protein C0Q70_01733 [Pomacea canaliculata]
MFIVTPPLLFSTPFPIFGPSHAGPHPLSGLPSDAIYMGTAPLHRLLSRLGECVEGEGVARWECAHLPERIPQRNLRQKNSFLFPWPLCPRPDMRDALGQLISRTEGSGVNML